MKKFKSVNLTRGYTTYKENQTLSIPQNHKDKQKIESWT
jgi:hypothetical protein